MNPNGILDIGAKFASRLFHWFGDPMNWYLGKRYEPLLKCVNHGGKFTAYELGIPGMVLKGLADDGYLKLVEKRCTHPARPNLYVVPEKVCQHFLDG